MSQKPTTAHMNLRMTVHVVLFTALIIIGGYISVPLPVGPVPIVLADFFVMVTGLFLGFKWGLTGVTLYLCLGALGLLVFSGGTSGLGALSATTGDIVFNYLPMAASVRFISNKANPSVVTNLLTFVAYNILSYAVRSPSLTAVTNFARPSAFATKFT